MDSPSRCQIELMDRLRVHIAMAERSSFKEDFQFHNDRPPLERDIRFQKLCQKAITATLTSEEAEELGETLFHMLFNEAARLKFLEVYNRLRQRQQLPFYVELTIDEKVLPNLARLPWEFLRLPLSEQNSALWLSSNPHLCFLRRPLQHGEPLSLQLGPDEKMKIAVVVADALPDAPVHYIPIVELLQTVSCRVPEYIDNPKVVLEGTRKNIIRELRSFHPHLIHFIGHGRFTEHMRGEVALVQEPSIVKEAEWVSAEQFGELFEPAQPWLKVVLLQACESAAGSQTSTFASIAAHVLSHRIPAVVAMQYEISNMTAECFARTFYDMLLRSGSVDQAVQEARFAIGLEPTPSGHHNYYGYFATPVLFRSANDGQMLEGRGNLSTAISPEAMAIDHGYRSVRRYLPILEETVRLFVQETTLARDRCLKCKEMLTHLHQDLSHLYEALDHPAQNMKRLAYTTLFELSRVSTKVQTLSEALVGFCILCPPPFMQQDAKYRRQRASITTTLQGVWAEMKVLDRALKPYCDLLTGRSEQE